MRLVAALLLCVWTLVASPALANPADLERALARWEGLRARSDSASATLDLLWPALADITPETLRPDLALRVASAAWGVGNGSMARRYDTIAARGASGMARGVVVPIHLQRLEHLLLDSRFTEAREAAEQARADFRACGAAPVDLAWVDWANAEAHRELGEVALAEQRLTTADHLLRAGYRDDPRLFVRLAIARADLFAFTRAPQKAVAALLAAISALPDDSVADTAAKGRLFARLGAAYADLGQMGQAKDVFDQARQLLARNQAHPDVDDAFAMLNLEARAAALDLTSTATIANLGRPDGLAFASRLGPWFAVLVREGGGSVISYRTRAFEATMLDFLSAAILMTDDASAKSMLEGFIVAAASDPNPEIQARAVRARASLDMRTSAALTHLRNAPETRRRAATSEDSAAISTLSDLGALQLLIGAPQSAALSLKLATDRQAVRTGIMGRSAASSGDYSFGGMSWIAHIMRGGKSNPLDIAFPLYLEALDKTRIGPAAASDDAVFRTLQYATQTDLSATMASIASQVAARDPKLAALLRSETDLNLAIAGSEAILARKLAAAAPDSARIATDLRAKRRALDALRSRIARDYPRVQRLNSEPPVALADLQAALGPDEAMVLVVGGGDLPPALLAANAPQSLPFTGVYVAAISRDRFLWKRTDISSVRVAELARRLRCQLDQGSCGAEAGGGRAFDLGASYELYRSLLLPLQPGLAAKRSVFFVANGALSSLPFSVLTTGPAPTGWRADDPRLMAKASWLIRDYAISSESSAASFLTLRMRRAGSESRAAFVGFGDPVLTPPSAPGGLNLAPLPWSGFELRQLQATTHAAPQSIFTGAAATETAVKRTNLARVKIIAFSTHGLTAGTWPGSREPGLVLTPPAAPVLQDDGFLSASEVSGLQLDADLVILSACRTAASDGTPEGDSLSGLARAFFHAGARSLLVSYWEVKDDVAAVATSATIRRRIDSGMPLPQALRATVLAMIDNPDAPETAHPALWAPLVLIGDTGGAQ